MRIYDEPTTVYGLARDLFCAAAVSCFLYASHRVAHGVLLGSRVKAYDGLADAYTPEEREVLIHRIKVESMR